MTFVVGQRVVLRGRALGVIQSISTTSITIEEADLESGEESQFEVPVERAGELLRPLVERERAQQLIAQLCSASDDPNALPVGQRAVLYRRAHKSGDLNQQAAVLAAIYRRPIPEAPERQYRELLEKTVFQELSHVLGKSRKKIKADIRAATLGQPQPAALNLPDRSAELSRFACLPPVAGLEPIGAFAVESRIAIGEAHPGVVVEALPGIWLAYSQLGEDGIPAELVAVHESAVTDIPTLSRKSRMRGEAVAEGATMAIFDATMASDDEFVDEVLTAGEGIVSQRCAVTSSGGGDGRFPVRVAEIGDQAAYVRIVF